MINDHLLREIEKLLDLYHKRFDVVVDFVGLPSNLTQGDIYAALLRVVDTGESLFVGLQKTKESRNKYSFCEKA